MKAAGERSKHLRSLRQESRRSRLLLLVVVGFFLATLTFAVVSKPEAILFTLNSKVPAGHAPATLLFRHDVDVEEGASRKSAGTFADDRKVVNDEEEGAKPTGGGGEGHGQSEEHQQTAKHEVTLPTVSDHTIRDTDDGQTNEQEYGKTDDTIKLDTDPEQNDDDARSQQPESVQWERKRLCDFSNPRANVCEMRGDIRIYPNANSIVNMEPAGSRRDELWRIKPYARKGDEFCLSHITELTVRSSEVAPGCTKYHDVPAVVFALTGYTGNLFHDFTDVLVPLFTTAGGFDGEVELLITDMAVWWTRKYHAVLEKLSKYTLIDFKNDDQVHCFKYAIVGLHAYKEFTIDSSEAPHNYSMVDFGRFMRRAYSLDRDAVTAKAKPRLLIISRKRTRVLLNLNEVAAMAEELGYEVVAGEADVSSDVSQFARLVNSVDVMVGVHGAGLTNCAFLPRNATLIQIVPWGGLDWICRADFGDPAEAMGLRYRQYSISVDESSLTEQYPRDHEIFTNPFSFHKRGFGFIRQTFMHKQNVTIDCNRFRPILREALDHLNP